MSKKNKKSDQETVDSNQSKEQEYLDGWKRALADYENLQRDMGKRVEESRDRIKESFAHDLLPVMDNFEQAVSHAPSFSPLPEGGVRGEGVSASEFEAWMQGVLFIKKQFEDVVQSLGLEKISVEGEFDPNLHESVGEGDEFKEVRSGWKIGDKVIRPAQVIVKKQK